MILSWGDKIRRGVLGPRQTNGKGTGGKPPEADGFSELLNLFWHSNKDRSTCYLLGNS